MADTQDDGQRVADAEAAGSGGKGAANDLSVLGETVKGLTEQVSTLTASQAESSKSVNNLISTMQRQADEKNVAERLAADEKGRPTDDEMNNMTGAELISTVSSIVSETVNEEVGRLRADMGKKTDSDKLTVMKAEVEDLQSKNKDFGDWKPEMLKLVGEVPGLSVEQAYQLAKINDVDKATKLDVKYEVSRDKDVNKQPPYGGILPTSTQTVPSRNMSPKDAAEAAFDQVFGGVDPSTLPAIQPVE